MRKTLRTLLCGALGSVLAAAPAPATDGVVEINQERALAGGITATDTPGFPVVLSEPGSYRLTGNLTVLNPDPAFPHGILINVPGVTLDLNGFGLMGPITCTGSGAGLSCGSSTEGAGPPEGDTPPHAIIAFAPEVTVENGWVRGFLHGVDLRDDSRAERLVVTEIDGTAVEMDDNAVVLAVVASRSGLGVRVREGSVVSDTSAGKNRGVGFALDRASARGCNASDNGSHGFTDDGGSTIVASRASSNDGDGINTTGASLIAHNSISSNGNDQIEALGISGNIVGNVVSNSSGVALRLSDTVVYIDNAIYAGIGTPVIGGVDAGGNRCDGGPC